MEGGEGRSEREGERGSERAGGRGREGGREGRAGDARRKRQTVEIKHEFCNLQELVHKHANVIGVWCAPVTIGIARCPLLSVCSLSEPRRSEPIFTLVLFSKKTREYCYRWRAGRWLLLRWHPTTSNATFLPQMPAEPAAPAPLLGPFEIWRAECSCMCSHEGRCKLPRFAGLHRPPPKATCHRDACSDLP